MADNIGVFSSSTNTDAITTTNSSTGRGIVAFSATGTSVEGHATGTNAYAGFFNSVGAGGNGVWAEGVNSGLAATATSSNGVGVSSTVTGSTSTAVYASGVLYGVNAYSSGNNSTAVNAINTGAVSTAVYGNGTKYGVNGNTPSGTAGVCGTSTSGAYGGQFTNANNASGAGCYGSGFRGGYFVTNSNLGAAIYADGGAGTGSGDAGTFVGNVSVSGYLTKSGGGYRIDHPQDPKNKYLNHHFVESNEMKNVYDGVAQLDSIGRATISMPSYFNAANSDFRYQLTSIGGPAPNLHVSSEINENQFTVAGGVPYGKVSWQVTGVRADKWALANNPGVEIEKKGEEKGKFLHPELY